MDTCRYCECSIQRAELLQSGIGAGQPCPECHHLFGDHGKRQQSSRSRLDEKTDTPSKIAASASHKIFDAFTTAAHGFKVMMGNHELELSKREISNTAHSLRNLALSDMQAACKLSGLAEAPSSVITTELASALASCVEKKGERYAQNQLRDWSSKHQIGLDTSKNGHVPWFLAQENVKVVTGPGNLSEEDYPIYKANANLDLIHTSVPVGLEIKMNPGGSDQPTDVDLNLLAQIITRVSLQIRQLGYLSRSVCIGSTGRCSWLAVATFDCNRNERQLSILRLASTTDAAQLFVALGKQSLSKYLTHDGPHLIKALNFAKIDPAVCRVRCLAFRESGTRVYSVTPGIKTLRGANSSSGSCLGVARHPKFETLAFKVMADDDEFKREVSALSLLVPAYQKKHLFHYGLGFVSANDQGKFVEAILEQSPPRLADFRKEKGVWWNFEHCPEIPFGGCILMRLGTRTLQYPFVETLWGEALPNVAANLHIAHSLGLCHADVRCPNIVEFGPLNWLLIDWGMSCTVGDEVTVEKAGSRGMRAGARVKRLLGEATESEIQTDWGPEDDWDMLALMPLANWKSTQL